MWIKMIIAVIVGYLLGNLNGAVCASKALGDDVRTHGSGNAGLTNFVRSYGAGRAFAVIAIDAGKAIVGCLIGGFWMKADMGFQTGAILSGAGVLLGHVFPVFLGFRGGKGILSGLFITLIVDYRIALLLLVIFALVYFITWYVSLASVAAAVAFVAAFVCMYYSQPIVMLCGVFMGLLAIFMHRQNIVRLCKGQERKTNLFKK